MAKARAPVTFRPDRNTVMKMGYKDVRGVLDDEHVYDLQVKASARKRGFNALNSITAERVLEVVSSLEDSRAVLDIGLRTPRLGGVKLDRGETGRGVALVHIDPRREIYDPGKILEGLDGEWYAHNIITIGDGSGILGKHHQDYDEAFHVPSGQITFALADEIEPENPIGYRLFPGSRLFIPEGIDYVAKGKSGSVLMGYGTAEFDQKRLIPSEAGVLEALLDELAKMEL